VGEEGSQLAGGGDLGVAARWWWPTGQAGGQELQGGRAPEREAGHGGVQGRMAAAAGRGGEPVGRREGLGRWARCQLAPRSGRHEKIKVVLRPGPCGESIKRRPGSRVKVPEACLEAI
jgi:hypothetical protein